MCFKSIWTAKSVLPDFDSYEETVSLNVFLLLPPSMPEDWSGHQRLWRVKPTGINVHHTPEGLLAAWLKDILIDTTSFLEQEMTSGQGLETMCPLTLQRRDHNGCLLSMKFRLFLIVTCIISHDMVSGMKF
ncbi:hypothetical protein RRG08_022172 [Elysia crispata]|uniref:Uncharacterized protein n=1 Tax=Elysia crispata TaxID=231223 RepID=A0AAE1AH56_9GAST|nr:hypothetical protein RRG08_022172 [Elysia crispata]